MKQKDIKAMPSTQFQKTGKEIVAIQQNLLAEEYHEQCPQTIYLHARQYKSAVPPHPHNYNAQKETCFVNIFNN